MKTSLLTYLYNEFSNQLEDLMEKISDIFSINKQVVESPKWLEVDQCEDENFPELILNLHAAEDEGKTEDPTEHKKQKARQDEGRVFFTAELPQAAVVLIGFSVILLMANYYSDLIEGMMVRYLENPQNFVISEGNLGIIVKDVALTLAKFILPIGLGTITIAVIGTGLQTGFFFSFVTLKFNGGKLAPTWKNFSQKTIFSRTQILNSLKVFSKIIFVSIVAYIFVRLYMPDSIKLPGMSVHEAYSEMSWWIYQLIMVIGFLFLLMAIPDYFIQKAEYIEALKMSKQEVKQEYKELEGDPLVKQKIRERAREIASGQMIQNVKTADVVITNPTHYACAIKYDMSVMDAPKLVAKGVDNLALRIKEMARENGVPVVENKPLARSLYANVEVDESIPYEYYRAVAELLRVLDKFNVA